MVPRTSGLAIALLLLPTVGATQERPVPPAPDREVITCSAAPSKDVTLPGRDPLLIQCASPRPIKIQVLEINFREAPALVGSREGTTTDQLSIPVANGANKYLRVFRAGMSPFTWPIDVVRSGLAGPLPPQIPGGELFLTFERAPIVPQGFVIAGPSRITTVQPDGDPSFSFGGIADGRYIITPVYAGGRHGTIVEANVVSGQTTDVPLRAESIGGAEITTEGLQCQNTQAIKVWREDERKIVVEEKLYPTDPKTCRWRIDGLPLGWYLVSTVARGGRGSIMTFEVAEQKITYVPVAEAPVRVTGRVVYKGAPLPSATLLFGVSGEREVVVRTDERGEFTAALAVAGNYSTFLHHSDIMSSRSMELTPGDNYVDWDIANTGTIRVTADGFSLDSPILISMKGPSTRSKRLAPGTEVQFTGLASGTYTITAAQGTLRSKPIEVKLDTLNDPLDVVISPRDQR